MFKFAENSNLKESKTSFSQQNATGSGQQLYACICLHKKLCNVNNFKVEQKRVRRERQTLCEKGEQDSLFCCSESEIGSSGLLYCHFYVEQSSFSILKPLAPAVETRVRTHNSQYRSSHMSFILFYSFRDPHNFRMWPECLEFFFLLFFLEFASFNFDSVVTQLSVEGNEARANHWNPKIKSRGSRNCKRR